MTDLPSRLTTALSDRYAIESELGSGGMATVYLAQDLKHDRKVAVKVLRPELAAVLGAERFLSEIKVTANLQHPHILPLHDSGEADGFLFYVMPFVEGESLRARLDREKQLAVDEAVGIAKSVAGALDYAHRQGVIHRDIKPANILLHDGQPMVADFGIALAVRAAGGPRLTETGLSLGTPQYMSPEQASGDREVDGRADIYSLGCVLYEMLTGEPPHSGPTVQAVIAKLLTDDPRPVTELRKTVPGHVAATVHKALAKLPADRFGGAGEFVEAVSGRGPIPASTKTGDGGTASARGWGQFVWPSIAVLALLVAVWALANRSASSRPLRHLAVTFPGDLKLFPSPQPQIAISPDGRTLAFVGTADGGSSQVFLRGMATSEPRAIPGTEEGTNPFFSPHGEWLGLFWDARLFKISVDGGDSSPLADAPVFPNAGSWVGDTIYVNTAAGMFRVPAAGGDLEAVPLPQGAGMALGPVVPLPDGETVLSSVVTSTGGEIGRFTTATGEWRILDGFHGAQLLEHLPGGFLLVSQDRQLRAFPWDYRTGEIKGPFVRLADSVQVAVGTSDFIAYVKIPASAPVWVDREGRSEPIGEGPFPESLRLRISPDETRIVGEAFVEGQQAIWLYDLGRHLSTYAVPPGFRNLDPSWHPTGDYVTYSHGVETGGDSLLMIPVRGNGEPQLLWFNPEYQVIPHAWSRDGRYLAAYEINPVTGRDIWLLSPGGEPEVFLATEANERSPLFSPDGKWMAYASDKSGRSEVWITSFPDQDREEPVSVGGGRAPTWSRDGTELYYRNGNRIYAVPIQLEPSLEIGRPSELFRGPFKGEPELSGSLDYDVMPDGSRFLLSQIELPGEIQVLVNWMEMVRDAEGGR